MCIRDRIQPDCNIPCGESLVRQGLYGQRYFREKLGAQAKVGYNVDSFGHNGNLPQILKKSGMDYYVFMRPMPGEKALPARLFRWESNDGSSVLAFRILFEYLSGPEAVSYTHLDVYKRQPPRRPPRFKTSLKYFSNKGGDRTATASLSEAFTSISSGNLMK